MSAVRKSRSACQSWNGLHDVENTTWNGGSCSASSGATAAFLLPALLGLPTEVSMPSSLLMLLLLLPVEAKATRYTVTTRAAKARALTLGTVSQRGEERHLLWCTKGRRGWLGRCMALKKARTSSLLRPPR